MIKKSLLLGSLLLATAATPFGLTQAGEAAATVSVENPYARANPPGQMNSAMFVTLKNSDTMAHKLVSATSDASKVVELHTHIEENGVFRMRRIEGIDVAAGDSTVLKPGGLHIMLIGLTRQLKVGEDIQVKLTWADGSTQDVTAPVQKIMPPKGKMGGMMNHDAMNHGAMDHGNMGKGGMMGK